MIFTKWIGQRDITTIYGMRPSKLDEEMLLDIHKDIFACLFSIHNIISLSCHEQVSLRYATRYALVYSQNN